MKNNDILVSIILAIGFFGFFGILGFIDFFVGGIVSDVVVVGIVSDVVVVGIVSYLAYDVSVSFDIVSTFSAALVIAALGAFYGSNVRSDLGSRSFNN